MRQHSAEEHTGTRAGGRVLYDPDGQKIMNDAITQVALVGWIKDFVDRLDSEPFPTCGRARRVARSPCLAASNAVGVQPLRGLEQVLGQF